MIYDHESIFLPYDLLALTIHVMYSLARVFDEYNALGRHRCSNYKVEKI